MFVVVLAEWDEIMQARDYWEVLLDQRPDEDYSQWEFHIPCPSLTEVVAAYHEFSERLKLPCRLSMRLKGDKCNGFAASDHPSFICNGGLSLIIREPINEIEAAARQAIETLQGAIR